MIRMNKTTIFGIAIFVVILFIGIGYAFLSSNLNINGIVNVSKKNIICVRSGTHTDKCAYQGVPTFDTTQFSCREDGYGYNSTITYGNSEPVDGKLTPGDPFQCNVTGENEGGIYQFYYVADLDKDDSYAVLVWAHNVREGSYVSYESGYTTNYSTSANTLSGPNNAYKDLPSIVQWPNVRLANTERALYDETGMGGYGTFDYVQNNVPKAARFLTLKEVVKACPTLQVNKGKRARWLCEYLLEDTTYHGGIYMGTSMDIKGYWLETVYPTSKRGESGNNKAYVVDGFDQSVYPLNYNHNDGNEQKISVRPAIEVKKSQIEY